MKLYYIDIYNNVKEIDVNENRRVSYYVVENKKYLKDLRNLYNGNLIRKHSVKIGNCRFMLSKELVINKKITLIDSEIMKLKKDKEKILNQI